MEVLTFGHSTVARRGKSRPRIENTSQNPKVLPRIQKCFPESKHVPESKNISQNSKTLPRIQHTSQNPKTLLDSGKCFWILGSVLDSGTCFWFLRSVLDSGKCFRFWEVFCPGYGTIQLKPFDPTERFFSVALFCLVCCTNWC